MLHKSVVNTFLNGMREFVLVVNIIFNMGLATTCLSVDCSANSLFKQAHRNTESMLFWAISFVGRSQDFCCEMCGTSMKTALLPLTSGSVSSQADKEAKELARQISFKVKSLCKLPPHLYRIRKKILRKNLEVTETCIISENLQLLCGSLFSQYSLKEKNKNGSLETCQLINSASQMLMDQFSFYWWPLY